MKKLRFCLALILCSACLLALPVHAFARESEAQMQLIDPEELEGMTRDFIEEYKLNEKYFSVGYCYTATGDTWYFNGDKWYYSASMYKVPLMMLLAEEEAAGKIDRDTPIKNLPLGQAEELILTYSNNDYAHLMMSYFGTEPDCRDLYKRYSELPDDYYISDFRDYSYFTANFMTDVMKTLYFESERFPNIIESLLPAQPEHYFKMNITDYDVAQKYGALKEFNHTAAIVYTPNPFIITVMTEYCATPETVIAAYGKLMQDYTLQLDEKLEAYLKELEERQKREEEETRELEKLKAEQEAQARAEAARQTPEPEIRQPEEDRGTPVVLIAVGGALLLVAAAPVLVLKGAKKRKSSSRKAQYIPKH